jgi:excisionase family DNA binding protein
MRYHVRVTRAQRAERTVRAADEDDAIARVQAEFNGPYGYFGSWETVASEVEVIHADTTLELTPNLKTEGPLLLSVAAAAEQLGISRGMMYDLVRAGEIAHLKLGSRTLISRKALFEFVETNERRGPGVEA